jgi:hypothetical protein
MSKYHDMTITDCLSPFWFIYYKTLFYGASKSFVMATSVCLSSLWLLFISKERNQNVLDNDNDK